MKARVYLQAMTSLTIRVDVPDNPAMDDEERRDAALAAAYDQIPRGICANCSGWRTSWSKDEGEYEALDKDPVEWIEEGE